MNYETITVEDCIDNYEKRSKSAIINAGQVVGFEIEE